MIQPFIHTRGIETRRSKVFHSDFRSSGLRANDPKAYDWYWDASLHITCDNFHTEEEARQALITTLTTLLQEITS